jgi:rhodanese-related sulfurtransferase
MTADRITADELVIGGFQAWRAAGLPVEPRG